MTQAARMMTYKDVSLQKIPKKSALLQSALFQGSILLDFSFTRYIKLICFYSCETSSSSLLIRFIMFNLHLFT